MILQGFKVLKLPSLVPFTSNQSAISMLLPTNLHDLASQFASHRRPILANNRIFFAITHRLLNVCLVQKMHKSLIIKLLSKPLKISHIPGTWTRWSKKRPAFVLKSCRYRKHFIDKHSVQSKKFKVLLLNERAVF